MSNLGWLYDPTVKPAKELSKHDQRMIKLGWDAAHTQKEERPDMTKEEASEIVKGAFGSRPDLPSGKDFVDEVRGH